MLPKFDFIVIGGGSAGAVIAARLSEDPSCQVALIEAGGMPPARELMPLATGSLQLDPETDWMFTADSGLCGLGLIDQRMPMPRGKMLGGSSGINYLAYVRGHPRDFDAWSENGATGWSYDEVLPYFKKSENLVANNDVVVDDDAHGIGGPLSVSVRAPSLPAAQGFVAACEAAGIPRGDYNGKHRLQPNGVVSLMQSTSLNGKRQSTYRSFLEDSAENRDNLTVLTGCHVSQLILDTHRQPIMVTGVQFTDKDGTEHVASARKEIILSAGAVGSPTILLQSGIGPRCELEAADMPCHLDLPGVGKNLKDHLHCLMMFDAPGLGESAANIAISLGPDVLRGPAGPLPAKPADDVHLTAELAALRDDSTHRLQQWHVSGQGLAASSLYDAVCFYTTGLGETRSHDAQIGLLCAGFNARTPAALRIDSSAYFDNVAENIAANVQRIMFSANPVLQRSVGEIVLSQSTPKTAPDIRMNYFADPDDLKTMVAVMRRTLEIAESWPTDPKPGALIVPKVVAEKHGYAPGKHVSDALLADWALYFATTVYHLCCTCRVGDVVNADLSVKNIANLRVADASVFPDIISGNINAACIMVGEKAAEMIGRKHGVALQAYVGSAPAP
jgi:choline dehydrogenase-like flavoprotein